VHNFNDFVNESEGELTQRKHIRHEYNRRNRKVDADLETSDMDRDLAFDEIQSEEEEAFNKDVQTDLENVQESKKEKDDEKEEKKVDEKEEKKVENLAVNEGFLGKIAKVISKKEYDKTLDFILDECDVDSNATKSDIEDALKGMVFNKITKKAFDEDKKIFKSVVDEIYKDYKKYVGEETKKNESISENNNIIFETASKNPLEDIKKDYKKIAQTIVSLKTEKQAKSVEKLITNFIEKYKDSGFNIN